MAEGCQSCGGGPMFKDELTSATTAKFSGYVGLVDAQSSWVARLIGRANAIPGVYAAHIPADAAEERDDRDAREADTDDD